MAHTVPKFLVRVQNLCSVRLGSADFKSFSVLSKYYLALFLKNSKQYSDDEKLFANNSTMRADSKLPATACLVFAICFFVSSATCARAAEPETWELVQTSLIAGKHRITVCPKAFKIQSIGNRYSIVSKAPDWKVTIFNPYAKLIFETELRDFKGNMAAGTGTFGGYLENLPILRQPRTKDTLLNLSVLTMHVNNPAPRKAPKKNKTFSGVFLNTGDIMSADYWMWNNPQLPPAFLIVVNKLYRFPAGAMPLKFVTVNAEKETNSEVETSSARRIPYNEKTFMVPQHFTVVKEELAIVNDSGRNRAVKNLIQNWDQWGKIVETGK